MDANIPTDFPVEKFYPIKDNSDLLIRLTVGVHLKTYWVEVDLVAAEGQKIIHHFGLKQNLDSYFDAIQSGLHLYQTKGL